MIYILTIFVIIVSLIVDKIQKANVEIKLNEIKEKALREENRLNEKKCFIIERIVIDRICKYQNQIWFVVTKNRLLKLVWSENGKELKFVNIENIIYLDIELEDEIEKDNKEYLMYSDVKEMLINMFDILLPDMKELTDTIDQTQRSVNIAKNIENGTNYIQLLEKYLSTMDILLNKALDLFDKYKCFIKEIFAQYEIDKFEKTMNVALIERDIDYKSMEDNLSNQYKEYSNYRKVYEDLSIELKETF